MWWTIKDVISTLYQRKSTDMSGPTLGYPRSTMSTLNRNHERFAQKFRKP